jgi:hypothetical protein
MFNEIYSSTLLVCMVTITNVSSLLVIYLNKSYGSLLIFSTLSKLKCYTLGVMHQLYGFSDFAHLCVFR